MIQTWGKKACKEALILFRCCLYPYPHLDSQDYNSSLKYARGKLIKGLCLLSTLTFRQYAFSIIARCTIVEGLKWGLFLKAAEHIQDIKIMLHAMSKHLR